MCPSLSPPVELVTIPGQSGDYDVIRGRALGWVPTRESCVVLYYMLRALVLAAIALALSRTRSSPLHSVADRLLGDIDKAGRDAPALEPQPAMPLAARSAAAACAAGASTRRVENVTTSKICRFPTGVAVYFSDRPQAFC